jgi:hypothetical protein
VLITCLGGEKQAKASRAAQAGSGRTVLGFVSAPCIQGVEKGRSRLSGTLGLIIFSPLPVQGSDRIDRDFGRRPGHLTEPDSVSIVLAIHQLAFNHKVRSLSQLRRKRSVAAVKPRNRANTSSPSIRNLADTA